MSSVSYYFEKNNFQKKTIDWFIFQIIYCALINSWSYYGLKLHKTVWNWWILKICDSVIKKVIEVIHVFDWHSTFEVSILELKDLVLVYRSCDWSVHCIKTHQLCTVFQWVQQSNSSDLNAVTCHMQDTSFELKSQFKISSTLFIISES